MNQLEVERLAEENMPRITEGEGQKAFLARVLRQLRYELELRIAREIGQ